MVSTDWNLGGLPKVPPARVGREAAFDRALPFQFWLANHGGWLKETLRSTCQVELQAWAVNAVLAERGELERQLPGPTTLVVLGRPPYDEPLIVELDLQLAIPLVDAITGGLGDRADVLRPLTEAEAGGLAYLILRVLQLAREAGLDAARDLRLLAIHGASSECAALRSTSEWFVLGWRVELDGVTGFVRLLCTDRPTYFQADDDSALFHVRRALQPWAEVRAWGRAILGVVIVPPAAVMQLGEGDVLWVESEPALHFGRRPQLCLSAELLTGPSDSSQRLRVSMSRPPGPPPPPPAEVDLSTDPGVEDAEDLDPTQLVLEGVALELEVQLARIPVTIDQLLRLRSGQIIELHRWPKDPVELVLDDRSLARGEIVDIDGRLGIRVLSVRRSS